MIELLAASDAAGGEATEGFNVLGVPVDEFIIGTIAFLIVFALLGKVLLPKIASTLAEREAAIEAGLRKAEEAEQQSAQAATDYQDLVGKAREEAAAIRTQAQAERVSIIDEARNEAAAAAAQVTASATAQIEAEKAKAVSELRKSVGTMATDLAGRIIGETLSDDARARAVVDRFIAEIEQTATEASEPI